MLKEPGNVSCVIEERFLEVFKSVMTSNAHEEYQKQGDYLKGILAKSYTLFGKDVDDIFDELSFEEITDRLEGYLVSLDIPPSEVTLAYGFGTVEMFWYPRGKMSVTSNNEYLCLLKQFQEYIDSLNSSGLFDLRIQPYSVDEEFNRCTNINELPLEFSKETFYLKDTEKIEFNAAS